MSATEAAREFKPGDRVRLVGDGVTWRDPAVARRHKAGRIATVVDVYGTWIPAKDRSYLCEFDRVGNEKKCSVTVGPRYLSHVETPDAD